MPIVRLSHSGAVALCLLATCATFLPGCRSKDSTGASSAPSTSAAASATRPAKTTSSTPSPWLWEASYDAVSGEAPTRSDMSEAVAECYPPCANYDARTFLTDKYKGVREQRAVEALRRSKDKQKAADEDFGPKAVAQSDRATALRIAIAAGMFPVVLAEGAQLGSYGAVGSTAPIKAPAVIGTGPELDAFRAELVKRPGWDDPFQCQVLGWARVPRRSGDREANALGAGKSGQNEADLLACTVTRGGSTLTILLEAPVTPIRVTATRTGDRAKIDGYEVVPGAFLDAEVRKRIDAAKASGTQDGVAGITVEVQGIGRLQRHKHGALAYAALQERGMPNRMAITAAEYKHLWVATFEYQCESPGLGCKEFDGRLAPSVRMVTSPQQPVPEEGKKEAKAETKPAEKPTAPNPAPAPPAPGVVYGRWEDEARKVDMFGAVSSQGYWKRNLPTTLLADAVSVKRFGAPGLEVALAPSEYRDHEVIARWREGVKKAGGFEPIRCTLVDLGHRTRVAPTPVFTAALENAKETAGERPAMHLICTGDDATFRGKIVVEVPSHAAWMEGEKSGDKATIKGYHLDRHGYFPADLRDKLMDVGVGTVLKISNYAAVRRVPDYIETMAQGMTGPVWVVALDAWQCPHEGLGCAQFDGGKAPTIEVVELRACEASTFEYK